MPFRPRAAPRRNPRKPVCRSARAHVLAFGLEQRCRSFRAGAGPEKHSGSESQTDSSPAVFQQIELVMGFGRSHMIQSRAADAAVELRCQWLSRYLCRSVDDDVEARDLSVGRACRILAHYVKDQRFGNPGLRFKHDEALYMRLRFRRVLQESVDQRAIHSHSCKAGEKIVPFGAWPRLLRSLFGFLIGDDYPLMEDLRMLL